MPLNEDIAQLKADVQELKSILLRLETRLFDGDVGEIHEIKRRLSKVEAYEAWLKGGLALLGILLTAVIAMAARLAK